MPVETGTGQQARPAVASAAHPAILADISQSGIIATPTQRKLHEPAFVSQHGLATYDDPEPSPSSAGARWPIILGGILGLGAIVAGAIVALSRGDEQAVTNPPARTPDAGVAIVPSDAAVIAVVPHDGDIAVDDALIATAHDASVHIHASRDAGHGGLVLDDGHPMGSDDGSGVVVSVDPSTHRGTIAVQIMTKPDSARLFVGTTYRGPANTTIEEPAGTVLDVQCRAPGYKPGTVRVAFDGRIEAVLCVMTRIKICIDNIKNPFDDCEIDPTRPSPDHSERGSN
jgi:hypothetical protein